jgi:EmrB/QacA subfamily drug resistance transporter
MTAPAPRIAAASSPPADEGLPGRWIAMFTLLAANFMNLIDVTIVNVALPSLQRAFQATPNQIEWVVAAYIFSFALGLLPAGRAGDLVGRRRMFIWGVAVFTLASALCGLAPSVGGLIAARVLQGIGGAMMAPQTLALVPALFPPQERGGVFALFGLTAGLASVAGPVIGGLLIAADIHLFGQALLWRPIFLVNIPIGLGTILMALRFVPRVPGQPSVGVDLAGAALGGATLFLILLPLIEGRALGWPMWCVAAMASALPMAWLFVMWLRRREARQKPQVIPLSLLRERRFLMGASLAALLFSGVPGLFFAIALYLQNGFGLDPFHSGLTTIPFPTGVFAASLVSNRLGARWPRARVAGGAALLVLGTVLLRHEVTGAAAVVWAHMAVPLFIAGCGLGTAVSPIFQIALSAAAGRDAGSASGAVQTFQQVGAAFGIAIMGELFFARLADAGGVPQAGDYAAALSQAVVYAGSVFALIGLIVPFLPAPPTGAVPLPRTAAPPAPEV